MVVEVFDPAALIRRVDRRLPAAHVAAHFGIPTGELLGRVRRLRRDEPNFPVKRRRLRRVIYVEPAAPA